MNIISSTELNEVIKYLKDFEIENIQLLNKGYSEDKKYILNIKDNSKLLLKISHMKNYERKKDEYHYLQIHNRNNVKCQKPVALFKLDNNTECAFVMSYIEGECADETLPKLSLEDQYNIGYQSSVELKKIHQVRPKVPIDWYIKRWNKYKSKKDKIKDLNASFYKQAEIEKYIESNYEILKGSDIRFQHDDFQPMNIIVKNKELEGIIDFDRFSFGDPVEEFFKIPKYTNEISISFSKGQVDGYLNGQIDKEFWRKYNLFVALNFHASIIDGYTYNKLEEIQERQKDIYDSHDFITHGEPEWYKSIDKGEK